MFERFTEQARQVVILAQDEARSLRHNYIGTEHILLGLLRVDESFAASTLESLDVTLDRVRSEVIRVVSRGAEIPTGQIPFTPRAKRALELALREAISRGHRMIGPEHILLALVQVEEGVAVRVVEYLGTTAEEVRAQVGHLSEQSGKAPARLDRPAPRSAKPKGGELPFTHGAKKVLDLAQDEARGLKHHSVGAEHILLALLRVEESLVARILESLEVTVEEVRSRVVVRLVGEGKTVVTGEIPLAPRAEKIVQFAVREARSHGHRSVGTEHLLLGLGHEMRIEIIRMISGKRFGDA
jgi:ATP-dependent Clp protease ATP-binding subunit ClpA